MFFGIIVVFAVVIDAHETLNARDFFAKFPQCATHHAPVLSRLPPNVLQFNTIRNNTSNDVCNKVLIDLNEMDDVPVKGCGDLCSILDHTTVKVGDKLYYATVGDNKEGHTVYNKDVYIMAPDLKGDNKFKIHTAGVKSKNGASVTVEWSGDTPVIGDEFDLSATKGVVGPAKGAPWTIGFGNFASGFEPVYVRDIKTHAWKWATDRHGYFGGAGATNGKLKDGVTDITVDTFATKLQEIWGDENRADKVVEWGLGDGKEYLEAIFGIVGGPKCKDWHLQYGRPRGPPGLWNKKEGGYSAGCHSDLASLADWQGSLADPNRRWKFPELEAKPDGQGDWKLKEALKKYAWTNLWFSLNDHNTYPLATTPWESGTACAGARNINQKNGDGAMTKYCKLDWYGSPAGDSGWKLGEVMVFDGHITNIHEAMVLPGQTGEEHDKRVSAEFRARCECEVEGCGFANWDATFPFTGLPDPFEEDEVVEHPEVSQEEAAQEDEHLGEFDE
jgi:hypothetical protein